MALRLLLVVWSSTNNIYSSGDRHFWKENMISIEKRKEEKEKKEKVVEIYPSKVVCVQVFRKALGGSFSVGRDDENGEEKSQSAKEARRVLFEIWFRVIEDNRRV